MCKNLRTCDRTIPFLTRFKVTELGYTCLKEDRGKKLYVYKESLTSIPDLCLYSLVVNLNTTSSKFDTNGTLGFTKNMHYCRQDMYMHCMFPLLLCLISALLPYRLNSFRVKRASKLVLPTPESPIRTTKAKDCEYEMNDEMSRRRKVTFKEIVVFVFTAHS